ncbi:MAG: universal stress protein [Bacteroidales bacterium]|jgi:nucleotide-binding universal stress UspA family protein|nr:universal stress protein [Bacteroidales bacterium]
MYHIIVPVDFSDESLKGLELAILFAKKAPSRVQMVYVRKKSGDFNAGSKEEKKYAEKRFKEIVKEYQPLLPKDIKLDFIIKSGKIYKEVVSQAESFEKSFIVASTHGASGFEQFFIGSNALKIISATRVPVITLQGNKPPRLISKIVLPLDITLETRQKLPFTAEIAKWFDAEVHVVALTSYKADDIVKKLNSYSAQVCDYLKERGIKYATETLVGANLTDITIEYAKKVNAGLISIMTEQSVDVSNLVLGSYAQQMLNKSSIPVMSMNPKELFVSGAFNG